MTNQKQIAQYQKSPNFLCAQLGMILKHIEEVILLTNIRLIFNVYLDAVFQVCKYTFSIRIQKPASKLFTSCMCAISNLKLGARAFHLIIPPKELLFPFHIIWMSKIFFRVLLLSRFLSISLISLVLYLSIFMKHI